MMRIYERKSVSVNRRSERMRLRVETVVAVAIPKRQIPLKMNPSASNSSDQSTTGLSLRDTDLAIWREALTHLRHLSDDVWNGLKIFLTSNGFIFVAIMLLAVRARAGGSAAVLVAALSVCGIALTLAARYIFKRHRIYYLQMLAKKSLLEEDLGFYRARFVGSPTDLAFPWRLTPEVVAEIRKDPEPWIQKSIRGPGTIARVQFLIYEALIGFYCVTLLASLIVKFS